VAKEAGATEEAALVQVAEHEHGDGGDGHGVDTAGVVGGIVGASDGGLALKARVLGGLAAQLTEVPGGFSGLTIFVKAVARALAGQAGADDLPLDMGRGIEAHELQAGIGQSVEPLVETGKTRARRAHRRLAGCTLVNAFARLVAGFS
jgi:hypothetical protein